MSEFIPLAVHLKMKLSMFVQVWIPYLLDEDQKKFLKLSGFSNEYVELEMPSKSEEKCEHCGAAISVPEGSFKAHCDKCFKVTRNINWIPALHGGSLTFAGMAREIEYI